MPTETERPYQYIVPVFEDVATPDYIQAVHDIGATTVLLCVREMDIRTGGRIREMQMAAESSRELGLDVWTDPWSLAGMFGGEEALTWVRPEDRCPDNPEVKGLLSGYLAMSADLGASHIFLDEPKLDFCGHKGSELPYLKRLADKAGKAGMDSVICMLPSLGGVSNAPRLAELALHPHVKGVGVDPYYNNFPGENDDEPERYIGRAAREMLGVELATGVKAHAWVQGFGIPMRNLRAPLNEWYAEARSKKWHEVPLMAAEAMVDAGLCNIGFWGSRDWGVANQNTINIRPPFPEQVWETAARIGEQLREKSAANDAAA